MRNIQDCDDDDGWLCQQDNGTLFETFGVSLSSRRDVVSFDYLNIYQYKIMGRIPLEDSSDKAPGPRVLKRSNRTARGSSLQRFVCTFYDRCMIMRDGIGSYLSLLRSAFKNV